MQALFIPRLGVGMTEAVLSDWLVGDGEPVTAGQVVYRLETDKVENDVDAPCDGILRHMVAEGETFEVGTQVGVIE